MWDDADTIANGNFSNVWSNISNFGDQRGYENTAFHGNNDRTSGGPSNNDNIDKETDWISVLLTKEH